MATRLNKTLTALAFLMLAVICNPFPASAQGGYNSGSTGADGAFNPSTSQTIQVPESGVFNYTTINIPFGVTITYTRNSRNTPVTILATGNIVINGAINVDGKTATSRFAGGVGGPGGFNGGHGAFGFISQTQGGNGEGPGGGGGGRFIVSGTYGSGGGGGFAAAGQDGFQTGGQGSGVGGLINGSPTLIPLIGGSGGGGGPAPTSAGAVGASGGGGGGAVLIASSGTISGSGTVFARGGAGDGVTVSPISSFSGGGSGGAVRLAANAISGPPNIQVSGGNGGNLGNGGAGYVRIEAFDLSNFNPNITPASAIFTVSTPKPAIPSNLPQLRVTSVAGVAAPTTPAGSFGNTPDVTVPTAQTNPVPVELAASNIPVGNIVQVKVTPEAGAPTTVQSTPLAGTLASSTATANVTLPTGVCLISVTTTIDLALMSHLKPIFIDGERVRKMEISATFGRESEITYITESGKRIKRAGE
jgi:hypothetical protein